MPDDAELEDFFGGALAAGDYDDDGVADLAVGVQGEQVGGAPTAGGVLVLEGDATSLLDIATAVWLDKLLVAIPGNPVGNDAFGSALGN